MNEKDRKRIQKIIEQVAVKEGARVETVRKEMQTAITDAFNKRHEPGHETFIGMFGNRCPSIEEFILKTAALNTLQIHGIPCRGEKNEGRT